MTDTEESRLAELVRAHSEVDTVYVAGYLDLDTTPPEVHLYPKVVALGVVGRLLVFRIESPSGLLSMTGAAEMSLPEELFEEPSIQPYAVDLANLMLDGTHAPRIVGLRAYTDVNSDLSRALFRAVVLTFDDGRTLSLDPFSTEGIRLGTDFEVWGPEVVSATDLVL